MSCNISLGNPIAEGHTSRSPWPCAGRQNQPIFNIDIDTVLVGPIHTVSFLLHLKVLQVLKLLQISRSLLPLKTKCWLSQLISSHEQQTYTQRGGANKMYPTQVHVHVYIWPWVMTSPMFTSMLMSSTLSSLGLWERANTLLHRVSFKCMYWHIHEHVCACACTRPYMYQGIHQHIQASAKECTGSFSSFSLACPQ